MEQSTSLSAGRPASRSPRADCAAESPTIAGASQSSLSGWLKERMRGGSYGRTCLRSSPSTEDATLPLFSQSSPDGTFKPRTAAGGTPGSSPVRRYASAFRGECWTQDIPEFPHFQGQSRSEGAVSSLSDAVVPGSAPQRYCLEASYAEAMLARAERLGYRLPPALENVLRESASR